MDLCQTEKQNKMMNSKIYLILISLGYLVQSCEPKNNSEKVYLEYIRFDSSCEYDLSKKFDTIIFKNYSTVYFKYNTSNKLLKIRASLDSTQYGHFFEFEKNGDIKNYYYLIGDDLHSSLEIRKDQDSKKYIERGSPFVDYMRNAPDSGIGKYSLLFSTFPRTNLQISFSLDGKDYRSLSLHKSRIMPFLYEVDIPVDKSSNKVFLRIIASKLFLPLSGLRDSSLFHDTLTIK